MLGSAAVHTLTTIAALRKRYDREKLPVIYVNDNWMQWQGDFKDLVEACLTGDNPHSRTVARRLAPRKTDFYVLKPKQSGFMASALPVLLAQLQVDAITLAGFASDACVLATAMDAHMREYRVWVPEDCSAAISPERHRCALGLLEHNKMATCTSAKATQGVFPSD